MYFDAIFPKNTKKVAVDQKCQNFGFVHFSTLEYDTCFNELFPIITNMQIQVQIRIM